MTPPTAAKCRAEQARQLSLSETDPLLNRRIIAAKAAEAWGMEALKADEREAEGHTPLSLGDAKIAQQFVDEANRKRKTHAS